MNEYKVIVTNSLIELINQVSDIDKTLNGEKMEILHFDECIDFNKFIAVYRIVNTKLHSISKDSLGL